MPPNNNPIRIDPFFDGEGGPPQETQLPQYSGHTQQAVQPAPNLAPGYVDARQAQLSDGRPMAHVMRAGPEGLAGTVIPHATMGGIPQGTQPHYTQDTEVHVDPHVRGQDARVRLGDINANAIAAATEMAREVTPDPYDIETMRLRSSAVMQGIAAQSPHQPQMQQPAPTTGPQPPGNIPAHHLGQVADPMQYPHATPPPPQQPQMPVQQPVQPQEQDYRHSDVGQEVRRSRPLQAFTDEPQTHHNGREMRPIDLDGTPPPAEYGASRAPNIRVTFEIEHFGTHIANYHDVLVQPGFLVLVFDNAYQGGEMYEPPSGENTPPMALSVQDSPEAHLVHTTGFVYSHGGYRYCVLMIERSAPVEDVVQ